MKQIFLILLFIVCIVNISSAQLNPLRGSYRDNSKIKPIDKSILNVTYDLSRQYDTISKKMWHDNMILSIGEKYSKFYSNSAVICDSIYSAFLKTTESQKENADPRASKWLNDNQNFEYVDYYYNYPIANSFQTTRRIIGTNYLCDEPMVNPEWNIKLEQQKILGYDCQRAVTTIGGRTWECWFTKEIPVKMGPWKLIGLPGLVLKATSTDGQFAFTAIGVNQQSNVIYHYTEQFHKVSKGEMLKLEKLIYEDPAGLYEALDKKMAIMKNGKLTYLQPGDIKRPFVPAIDK